MESLSKARGMAARADGIKAAAGRAIYSDDPDAIDALKGRIALLEAERDRIKAYNASCRRGERDTSLLDEAQRETLLMVLRVQPHSCESGAFPGYALTNLSGNIARNRKRLETMSP